MSDFKKCTSKEGGYADNICSHLEKVLEMHPTKRSKGVYIGEIVNTVSGESKGSLITIKSGDHTEKGIALNYCPFCAGILRDAG